MGKIPFKNSSAFWIILAFIIWVFVFFGFLSSQLSLFEDAVSYCEHIKFFIENLAKGVFPLWDPFWCNGAPNDFFLRRFGAYNPFYFLIVLLEIFKIPYIFAYLIFLALYYWAGMIAFYLLAMRLYKDRVIAYGGYLILLFSSLGTRLFDSYMMLVTVPWIAFFYFLVAFSQTPRKHFFLGLCLSLMILCSTYIPFYFFSFLVIFLVFFGLFYFKQVTEMFTRYAAFFKANKVVVLLSLSLVLLSFIPSVTFFHNSNKGEIALPTRHGSGELGQALVVPPKTLDWGAVEDVVFSTYFSDFRLIRFAVIYIPLFAFIVFALGLFCRVSRRAMFMFACGFVMFCCIIPHGLPFYDFLNQHVFFLKYFRNLHFFLWFVLIPLFVLLILEHWQMFNELRLKGVLTQKKLLIYVLSIHVLVLLWVIIRGDAIFTTYGMLILSGLFWSGMILNRFKNNAWVFALLTMTILIQPLEVYHHLTERFPPFKNGYSYYFSYTTLSLRSPLQSSSALKSPLYYASGSYNTLYQNVSDASLNLYLQNKFFLVDHLKAIDRRKVDFSRLEESFSKNSNIAFIFENEASNITDSDDPNPSAEGRPIDQEDGGFKVLSFNANHVQLAVDVPFKKFLVYNDSYDSSWRVTVNGQKEPLYQTNVAFKGVWLKKGKNIVDFYYGSWMQYGLNIILILGAFALLGGIAWFFKEPEVLKEG